MTRESILALVITLPSSHAVATPLLKQKIANQIGAQTDAVSFESFHGMQLVKQHFFADGQLKR